jgi:hypothetical protein
VAERFTRNEQVGNSILPRGFNGQNGSFFGRGSKAVKCAWFRSKSFGFASSILALFSFFRCGVVGNMSGFHPVASGSIPGSGFFACIAQWQSGALVMLRSGIQSSVQAFYFF